MPLQKQNVTVSFKGGVETKVDAKQVLPGKLLTLENGIFTSPTRIKKRNGYEGLDTDIIGGGSISTGRALSPYRDELVQFSGNELYSYSEAASQFADKGKATSLELSTFPVLRNSYSQTSVDAAYHSFGLQLFTWVDSSGGSRYSVLDSATGQPVIADSALPANAGTARALAFGQFLIVLYVDTSLHRLRYIAISGFSAASPVDIATDVATSNANFDAMVLGDRLFVAYNNSDGGGGISLKYLSTSLLQSAELDVAGEAASRAISIFGDASTNQVWVAYYNATSVKYFVRDYNLSTSAVLAPTVVETVADIRSVTGLAAGGAGVFYYETPSAVLIQDRSLIRTNTGTNAGVVGTASVFLRSVGLASKPFTYGGVSYLTVTHWSLLQSTYFVVNSSGIVVAKISPGTGGGLTASNTLSSVSTQSPGLFMLPYLQIEQILSNRDPFPKTGVQGALLNFTSTAAYGRAELGENLHVTGGILGMYDGTSFVEHGFHFFPENVSLVYSATGGNITAGTYQYFGLYAWTDGQGQVHRSAPSIGISATVPGGVTTGSNAITFPTLRLTSKTNARAPVTLEIYRTLANGTIPYQVSSTTSPILNDTTVNTVTFIDTAADSTLSGARQLYTVGGVIENIAAPAVSYVATFGNRVIYFPSENRLSFGYSKEVVEGEPVEFSDLFVKQMQARGGDSTCGIQMDDKFIIFKRTGAYYMVGQGPAPTGAQDDFSEPLLIATASGCTEVRSLVLGPDGVFYKGLKGIYLLQRNLNAIYIGAAVEAYNGDSIVSATLIEDANQIRFCLSSGVALVYDYNMKDEFGVGQWSVFTNHAAVDGCIWSDRFAYLKSDGEIMLETPGSFTDDGAFIKLRLVTSWLKFAGLQGFQRVYRVQILGDYMSPHKLHVQIATDFNPAFTQGVIIDAAALCDPSTYGSDPTYGGGTVFGGAFQPYEFEVHVTNQKCEAIQVALEDTQSSSFGEGLSLSAIGLEVGVKAGPMRLPAARRTG